MLDEMTGPRTVAPLSAKFASLRCYLATIADPTFRASAARLLAEIEVRVRAVGSAEEPLL